MGKDDEAEANGEDLDVGPGEAASHQRSKRHLPPVVQAALARFRQRCVGSKLEGAQLEEELEAVVNEIIEHYLAGVPEPLRAEARDDFAGHVENDPSIRRLIDSLREFARDA